MCWEQKLVAHTVYKHEDFSHVVLQVHNKPEIQNSLNYVLLEQALARVSAHVPPKDDLKAELDDLQEAATSQNSEILNCFGEEY